MINVLSARLPRAFARMLALAGLSLAAVTADVSQAAAQPGPGGQLFTDPAITSYRLTSATLDRFIEATNALKGLEDEEFEANLEDHMDDPENMDLDEIARMFDNEPRIKGAINGAGLSSREYVTFLFAMIQAMFGSVMVQMGGENALAEMPAGVMKDNIQFFLANQETFEALGEDEDS